MAKKCGEFAVHVLNPDTREEKWFYPGDEYGAWAKFVDNPLAFEGGEAPEVETVGATAPPPAPGAKGATKEAWQGYANHYRVPFTQDMSVKELAQACADAGIAT